jgi:hypothetical protein
MAAETRITGTSQESFSTAARSAFAGVPGDAGREGLEVRRVA